MPTTFEVDRVQPALEPAPQAPLPEVFQHQVGRPFLACTDVDSSLLTETAYHPLAAAVHCAFAQHRPLVLTPDAVWLTVAQGFAQHVNTHSKNRHVAIHIKNTQYRLYWRMHGHCAFTRPHNTSCTSSRCRRGRGRCGPHC